MTRWVTRWRRILLPILAVAVALLVASAPAVARAQGIPRLINAICDNLLLTCFAMETKVANVAMLDEVSKDMRLEWPGSNRDRRPRSRYDLTEEPPSVSAVGD